VRTTSLSCGGANASSDGFWVVKRMKLPEATNATVYPGMTLDQCRQVCLSNCSCRAYAAANVSGGVSRGCVIWAVDLLDMRLFPTDVEDVYIRLAQSEIDALNAAGSDSDTIFLFLGTYYLLLSIQYFCIKFSTISGSFFYQLHDSMLKYNFF
jgi:hypothetical protein